MRWVSDLRQDVVFGVRNLFGASGFAIVAIGSIAALRARQSFEYSVAGPFVGDYFATRDSSRRHERDEE